MSRYKQSVDICIFTFAIEITIANPSSRVKLNTLIQTCFTLVSYVPVVLA